jgi:DNA repair photolyase
MGKSIYESKGKAGEYSKYAVSFFCGCSCGCHYCYNKTGRFNATLGGDTPTLKKCFKDEKHALEIFEKELKQNLPELQKHGLFFSFTSDLFLNETILLNTKAIDLCVENKVPVKVLTKRADFIDKIFEI